MVAAEIVTAGSSFFRCNFSDPRRVSSLSCSLANSAAFRSRASKFAAKMKGGGDDNSRRRPVFLIPKIPANPTAAVVARSAVVVLGLGFVDAGYSGDWSRIGAISKEVEDWLKVAAFFVVPLCVLLVVSISSTEEES